MEHRCPGMTLNAGRSQQEGLLMATALFGVMILSVVSLGFYALQKVNPGWVRVHASLARIFDFSIEAGQAKTDDDQVEQLDRGDGSRKLSRGSGVPCIGSEEEPGLAGRGHRSYIQLPLKRRQESAQGMSGHITPRSAQSQRELPRSQPQVRPHARYICAGRRDPRTRSGLQAEAVSAPHSHPKSLCSRTSVQVRSVMISALRSRERRLESCHARYTARHFSGVRFWERNGSGQPRACVASFGQMRSA